MKNRSDGKYLKPEDGLHKVMPFLFDNRTDSEVHGYKELDITKLLKFLEKKNKGVDDKRLQVNLFHAILTACGKVIYNRPILNRFIQGKRMYQRDDVTFAFVAKDKFSDEAEEHLITLDMRKNDNIKSVSENILSVVKEVRTKGENSIGNLLNIAKHLPRFFLTFIIWCLKKIDYYGLLPKSLMKNDIDFATILFSNLGSIKCDAIYHHLNNYGTTSIMITIGEIKTKYVLNKNGSTTEKKVVELGITIDERIADGFYFAKSFKLLDYIFENPELLDDDLNSKLNIDL